MSDRLRLLNTPPPPPPRAIPNIASKNTGDLSLVVPAQAGTQNDANLIPAFAGKTKVSLLKALRVLDQ